jgi:hypothetical protein
MIAWLYIHMSVTRWNVTPRNASLGPGATVRTVENVFMIPPLILVGSTPATHTCSSSCEGEERCLHASLQSIQACLAEPRDS